MVNVHTIIVNYNSGDWLQRSIGSALNFTDGLITVVDNSSQDSSVVDAQAKLDNTRLNWRLNDQNLGFAAANNQVLKKVSSDYALLMNPDCELNRDTLKLVLEAMTLDPQVGLASCRILNEDGSLQITCRRRFPTPWSAFVRMAQLNRLFPNSPTFPNFDYGDQVDASGPIEQVEAISGAFMLARMSAVKQVGLLDQDYFMHCEDLDWCKRFEQNNWKVAFVPAATVIHAKGVSTQSRPIGVLVTLHTGMNRFFDKFYRAEYSVSLRLAVKLGIVFSFIARAVASLIKTALQR